MIHQVQVSPSDHGALGVFIEKMKAAKPFGEVPWDDAMWDLSNAPRRAGRRLHKHAREALWFVQHPSPGAPRVPFARPFDIFAKAIVCARHLSGAQTTGAHAVTVRALRYLYDVLTDRQRIDPARLERRDFVVAEAAVATREKATSAYRVAQRLEEIARLVDVHRIVEIEVAFRSSLPRVVEASSNKMPSLEVLQALGDVSSDPRLKAKPPDLIMMRVVDLLVASGMRIGEVLTLSAEPIVEDAEGFGLRYWPEKGAETRIKRFSVVQRELVVRAVGDLRRLCSDARDVALWCEKHPGRVPLPRELPSALTPRDLQRLCLAKDTKAWLSSRAIGSRADGAVLLREVEAALASMRDPRPLVQTGNGKTQTLGESLIVLFLNETHAGKTTNRFVPIQLRQDTLADFLGARQTHGVSSVFSRYGKLDSTGKSYRITSHQFRHWLHTTAARGGLSDVELARWMGRKQIADNRAYDHRTHEERVEEARALIRAGRAAGAVSEAYHSLPHADAEAFLEAQVNAVLTTPYGMCVHDYGQAPCERHFSCAGCKELLRTKGDSRERAAIETALERTRAALGYARAERRAGSYGASNWVAHQERLEFDLIALLAVDAAPVADGTTLHPRPDGHGAKRC